SSVPRNFHSSSYPKRCCKPPSTFQRKFAFHSIPNFNPWSSSVSRTPNQFPEASFPFHQLSSADPFGFDSETAVVCPARTPTGTPHATPRTTKPQSTLFSFIFSPLCFGRKDQQSPTSPPRSDESTARITIKAVVIN